VTTGCTARVALDPRVVVDFLDNHTTYTTSGAPARRRHFINGYPVGQGNVVRAIRRWRAGDHATASYRSVERVLAAVGLSIDDLDVWASAMRAEAFIRE
jgi:hypothetical protein